MRKTLLLSGILVIGFTALATAHDNGYRHRHDNPRIYVAPPQYGYPPPRYYYGPPPDYYGPPPGYYYGPPPDTRPSICMGDSGFRFCIRP